MSTIVTYNGNQIATVYDNTKKLLTSGTFMTGDVTLVDQTLKIYTVRPDAELIETWSGDEYLVDDLEKTIPAYSTSAQTIVTGASLTPQIVLDYDNYNYFVEVRGCGIPTYSNTTPISGQSEYTVSAYHYEVSDIPANYAKNLSGSLTITSRSVSVTPLGSTGRALYWTSDSAVALNTASTYGVYIAGQSPAISSDKMTVKAPNYGIRGNTTYMKSAAWSNLEDSRMQWIIEVYRSPKGHGIDGWCHTAAMEKLLTDIATTNHKIT